MNNAKIDEYINNKKDIQEAILNLIDSEFDTLEYNNNILELATIFQNEDFSNNREELKILINFISKVTKNHHRQNGFFKKIEQILQFLMNDIASAFSNFEIFYFFKKNLRMILLLFQINVLKADDDIFYYIYQKHNYNAYMVYLYPEFKGILNPISSHFIEEKIAEIENYDIYRQMGENESYLCSLIRDDLVEDFIAFVNKTNISLSRTTIKPSALETNSFLIGKELTLIEYAAFFGSINIFQYLQLQEVDLKETLWLFVIHSNSPEMIHLLENNHVEPSDTTFCECYKEAIKCHHNAIASYIKESLMTKVDEEFIIAIEKHIFEYYNFAFMNVESFDKRVLYYLNEFDYIKLLKLYMSDKNDEMREILNDKMFTSLKRLIITSFPFSRNRFFFLEIVTICSSVSQIEDYAFNWCPSLKVISFETPSSVTSVGNYTFEL